MLISDNDAHKNKPYDIVNVNVINHNYGTFEK